MAEDLLLWPAWLYHDEAQYLIGVIIVVSIVGGAVLYELWRLWRGGAE